MPEGDTIYRAAQTLHRALSGRVVSRFESQLPALSRVDEDSPIAGRQVERVYSIGKHLLLQLSGGLTLRTHMRMNGSWHVYRPGEQWQRPRRDMRIVLATDAFEAVGFNVPVAEFVATRALDRHGELRRLGPDLLADDFDAAEALRRLRERRGLAIADALLDQRAMAGVGNVYKSEVLYACGVDPFTAVDALPDAHLACLIETARKFLRANVTGRMAPMTTSGGYRRTTRSDDPAQRLWVYGRAGKPCRRCDTPIAVRRHGDAARVTYWCPKCQRPGSSA
jgi:endonuclease VIII